MSMPRSTLATPRSGESPDQTVAYARSLDRRPVVRLPAPAAGVRRRLVAPLAIGVVWLVAQLFGWTPAPAGAQTRPIPAEARLGTLTVGIFPDAVLDGKAIRLGPGVRIHDTSNRIVVPSTIRNSALVVAYVTGNLGEIVSAWIVTDTELRQLRARRSGS